MNGIIILEGPDACGKTTLQKFLVSKYQGIGLHLTYPAPEPYEDMFDYQLKVIKAAIGLSKTTLVIVDRHWISEMIYAKVFRGGSPWPEMPALMSSILEDAKAIYVLCLPDNIDTALARHKANLDPSHPYDDVKFRILLQEYLDFATDTVTTRNDMVIYTIEKDGADLDKAADHILDFLMVRKELCK